MILFQGGSRCFCDKRIWNCIHWWRWNFGLHRWFQTQNRTLSGSSKNSFLLDCFFKLLHQLMMLSFQVYSCNSVYTCWQLIQFWIHFLLHHYLWFVIDCRGQKTSCCSWILSWTKGCHSSRWIFVLQDRMP